MVLLQGVMRPESQRDKGCTFKVFDVPGNGDEIVEVVIYSCFDDSEVVDNAKMPNSEVGTWLLNRLDW